VSGLPVSGPPVSGAAAGAGPALGEPALGEPALGKPAPGSCALGSVVVIGAHILDVLGRPVESIPPGQGSARLAEIRATAAGTAAGTAVDLAKLGAQVRTFGAIGDDLLADVLVTAMNRHGIDTTGLARKPGSQTSATILPIRPNGERPALHVPGATPLLQPGDVDLAAVRGCRALLIGAPDALGGQAAAWLPRVALEAKAAGALVFADVLHPGSRRDFDRMAGLLAATDWFLPNSDQLLALTGRGAVARRDAVAARDGVAARDAVAGCGDLAGGRGELARAVADVLALGTGGVAVTLGADGCLVSAEDGTLTHVPGIGVNVVDTTGCGDGFSAGMIAGLLLGCGRVDAAWLGCACGSLVATGLGSDAGIVSLDHAIAFLSRHQPAVADRIRGQLAGPPVPALTPTRDGGPHG
jgi:sugar/nucleoside kinase (ribokinase family)